MKRIIPAIVAIAALSLTSLVFAQAKKAEPAPAAPPAQAAPADDDKTGVYPGPFPSLDANKDGSLDMNEFHKAFPDGKHEDFSAMDANKDNKVTHDEWRNWRMTQGKQAGPHAGHGQGGMMMHGMMGGDMKGGMGGMGMMGGMKKAPGLYDGELAEHDPNKDGAITLDEFYKAFPDGTTRDFHAMDLNDDKKVDDAEWKSFQEYLSRHAGKMGGMGGGMMGGKKCEMMGGKGGHEGHGAKADGAASGHEGHGAPATPAAPPAPETPAKQ